MLRLGAAIGSIGRFLQCIGEFIEGFGEGLFELTGDPEIPSWVVLIFFFIFAARPKIAIVFVFGYILFSGRGEATGEGQQDTSGGPRPASGAEEPVPPPTPAGTRRRGAPTPTEQRRRASEAGPTTKDTVRWPPFGVQTEPDL